MGPSPVPTSRRRCSPAARRPSSRVWASSPCTSTARSRCCGPWATRCRSSPPAPRVPRVSPRRSRRPGGRAGDRLGELAGGSPVPASLVAPCAEAVGTREPVVVESRAERLGRYSELGRFSETGTTDGAFVVVPLVSGDAAHGALLLAFADNRMFSDDERAYLATLGRIGGQALARGLGPGTAR